jgi:hypothetical protein
VEETVGTLMDEKVIALEEKDGPLRAMLQNVMRMVPERDKGDIHLQRLLAFRLRIDGEAALREFLVVKIRDAIRCGYTGSLYEFLKDDLKARECLPADDEPIPPGAA